MNTKSFKMTKTLGHVLLAATILTVLILLLPNHCEAGSRRVIVRSVGRERIVVRNDYPRPSACRCSVVRENHHRRYVKAWVPGRFEATVKRHGRLKWVWVPGHWIRT